MTFRSPASTVLALSSAALTVPEGHLGRED